MNKGRETNKGPRSERSAGGKKEESSEDRKTCSHHVPCLWIDEESSKKSLYPPAELKLRKLVLEVWATMAVALAPMQGVGASAREKSRAEKAHMPLR